ncbi:MAG: ATP-binding protein [Muribaculaceae bacterium]|nr:ATP-binding protein [Muribaculaceae bacterium]
MVLSGIFVYGRKKLLSLLKTLAMNNLLHKIAPYNLWNGNNLPIGYPRVEYTKRLMKFTGNHLVKILTGQRRTGKSYIMRQLAKQLVENGINPKNILFINRELSVFDFIQTSDDLEALIGSYRDEVAGEGKVYIFIDEVQDILGWEKTINSLSQDYTFEAEIFISGSNSRLLSGELATLLSGRYLEMQVYPFSYTEYTGVWDMEKGRDSFLRYLKDGGLPELLNLPDEDVKQRYVEGLRDSIMLKDIVRRHAIKDVALLDNLFSFLVNNASSLISVTGVAKYMKGRGSKATYDTVAAYIEYLQEAFLLHKSVRYNISGKELLGGNFKMYPNDQAYHNYLFPTAGYGRGYALEGIVYMSLVRKGYTVNTGIMYNNEVDFVATSGGRCLYVQVAYSIEDFSTAEREYGAFKGIKGEGEKLLVTMDEGPFPMRDGVLHLPVWELEEYI